MPFSGLRGSRFPLPIAKVAESRISRDEYLEFELASEILELPDAGLTILLSELYREV